MSVIILVVMESGIVITYCKYYKIKNFALILTYGYYCELIQFEQLLNIMPFNL